MTSDITPCSGVQIMLVLFVKSAGNIYEFHPITGCEKILRFMRLFFSPLHERTNLSRKCGVHKGT